MEKNFSQKRKKEKKPIDSEKQKQKKSGAKANGLKSMLIIGDKVQMTSFGRGNAAVIEKEVVHDKIRDINIDKPVFSASDKESQYVIKRMGVNVGKAGYIDKASAVRNDLINAKDKLEERFFGEKKNDNVHIQVIYNILDFEKILAEHIDNIIYSLSNVVHAEDKVEDLVGFLGGKTYENFINNKNYEAFQSLYKDERLRFFGGAFFDTGLDVKAQKTVKTEDGKTEDRAKLRSEKDVYYMLSLLGEIRQFTKHGKGDRRGQTWLYSLDGILTEPEKEVLDKMYSARIDGLNKNFIKTSGKDLTVLFKEMNADTPEKKQDIVDSYYRYIVCKDARNMGFCIKTLREAMIERYMPEIREKKYDTCRSKLYKLFDFVILSYYQSGEGMRDADNLVNGLRSCLNEMQKEELYKKQAEEKWPVFKDIFKHVQATLGNGSKVRYIKPDSAEMKKLTLKGVRISSGNTTYFSKLMFLMTLFLDGKEINDLLTTLINKMENIQSFNDIMKENGVSMFEKRRDVAYDYSFFEQAGKIADELRVVKSVSRMETPLPSAKKFMYEDAMTLFGYEELEERIFKDEKTVRNFVANNVIESARFQYLIRYANVESAGKLAKCRPIVAFVLGKVPEKQIDRYWQTCGLKGNATDTKGKIKVLADLICNFDKGILTQKRLQEEKQTATAIIGLYLSVVYQIVKGLVNVNAKYTMAFHALERDTELLGGDPVFDRDSGYERLFFMTDRYITNQTDYLEKRIAEHKRANKHGLKCIVNSKESVDNKTAHYHICRMYRNAVAHLEAVSHASDYISYLPNNRKVTSYFALYHFSMQMYLTHDTERKEEFRYREFEIENSIIGEWAKAVEAYRSYNKDWLWALNAPFAYNPPRYKNLSIEDLFFKDKNAVVK